MILPSFGFRSCHKFLPWLLRVVEYDVGVWSQISPFFSKVALDHGIYHRTRRQNRIPAISHLSPRPGLASQERVASEQLMVMIYYNIKTGLEPGFYSHEVTETEKTNNQNYPSHDACSSRTGGGQAGGLYLRYKKNDILVSGSKGFYKTHLAPWVHTWDLGSLLLSLENGEQPCLFHPSRARMWKYCSKTHVWQVIDFPSPGTCWSTCLVASPSVFLSLLGSAEGKHCLLYLCS